MKKIPFLLICIFAAQLLHAQQRTQSFPARPPLPPTPPQSEWQYIGLDGDSGRNYAGHIRVMPDGSRRMWVTRIPKSQSIGDMDHKPLKRDVTLWELDCVEERSRIISGTEYYLDGTSQTQDGPPNGWTYVVPGTFGETLLTAACTASIEK